MLFTLFPISNEVLWCIFKFPKIKIRLNAPCVTLFDVPNINILQGEELK